MSIPTTSWDEASPAGSDNIALGDNRIREMKTQIREVIDVDHDFPSSGSAADVGQHKQVTLQEQADLGTGAVSATILGSQTYNGKGELTYTDEDDNDIQITSAGELVVNVASEAEAIAGTNNTHASSPLRVANALIAGLPIKIENRTTDPSTPVTGQIWLRTDL